MRHIEYAVCFRVRNVFHLGDLLPAGNDEGKYESFGINSQKLNIVSFSP